MKIVIDTENLVSPFNSAMNSIKEKSKYAWDKADAGHIALFGVSMILCGYIGSIKLDDYLHKGGSVDAYLEKPDISYKTEKKSPKTKVAQLYNTKEELILSNKEFDCLSRNIYWESMHEPLLGQMSVANVTYNRVLSGKWGNTFCDVVFAPKQFSWTIFKKIRNAQPKNKRQWERAKHSATLFTRGVRVTNLDTSQFYYAEYIKKPSWAKRMTKQAHIGQHIFFAQNED